MDDITLVFKDEEKEKKLQNLLVEYDAEFKNLGIAKTVTLRIDKEDLYVGLLTHVILVCTTPDKYLSPKHMANEIMRYLENHTIEDAGKALEAGIRFTDINLS